MQNITSIANGATAYRKSPATASHPQRLLVNNAKEVMSIIRLDVYKHDPQMLANRIGVSPSTIYAIRSGRTKWPRDSTTFALAHYLGYRFVMERTR